nr:MAG TPA: hypothetical protein [Caudoviricetes sp.]
MCQHFLSLLKNLFDRLITKPDFCLRRLAPADLLPIRP